MLTLIDLSFARSSKYKNTKLLYYGRRYFMEFFLDGFPFRVKLHFSRMVHFLRVELLNW